MDLEIIQLSRDLSDTQESESFIFFFFFIDLAEDNPKNWSKRSSSAGQIYNLYIIHTVESP